MNKPQKSAFKKNNVMSFLKREKVIRINIYDTRVQATGMMCMYIFLGLIFMSNANKLRAYQYHGQITILI